MSDVIHITSLDDDRVGMFGRLTEAQLRRRDNPEEAIIIVESPKVIRVALDKGLVPVALLCEERHIDNDASDIVARLGSCPIYTGSRDLLSRLTGYTLTRGVLCAMRRPQPLYINNVLCGAGRVAVIDSVVDTTNIGAIFRSAAALGIDAVLLTPTSCDPMNRRSIRVSMGSVFLVPWTWVEQPISRQLHQYGFRTVAMALSNESIAIDSPALSKEERLAIILGTEGDGLSQSVISEADYVARIPMAHGVDSLNVAAASAVAFWQLRKTI